LDFSSLTAFLSSAGFFSLFFVSLDSSFFTASSFFSGCFLSCFLGVIFFVSFFFSFFSSTGAPTSSALTKPSSYFSTFTLT